MKTIRISYLNEDKSQFLLNIIILIKNCKKYDLVNINSYFFSVSILSALIFKFCGIKYYLSLRGEIFKETLNYNYFLKISLMPIINYIYQNTKFLHCTTDQEKKSAKINLKGLDCLKIF